MINFSSLTHRCAALMAALTLGAGTAEATIVRMDTALGPIDVRLYDDTAPITVNNFLNYVTDGDYDNSFIHRSAPGFLIQGGGFIFGDEGVVAIETDPTIVNEFSASNLRGTIAMAKVDSDPDSADSQWYFNLTDNSDPLDTDNGGFTVFGEIIGNGLQVADSIGSLQLLNAGGSFTSIPLINYFGGLIAESNVVSVNSVRIVGEDIFINTAMNGAWLNPQTPGQGIFIDVLPQTGIVFISMFTYDVTQPDSGILAAVGAAGQRWLTAQGGFSGNTADLTVSTTSGGLFDTDTPVSSNETGTMTLTFNACDQAVLNYALSDSGLSGSIPLVRLVADNVEACVLQSIELEAAAQAAAQ